MPFCQLSFFTAQEQFVWNGRDMKLTRFNEGAVHGSYTSMDQVVFIHKSWTRQSSFTFVHCEGFHFEGLLSAIETYSKGGAPYPDPLTRFSEGTDWHWYHYSQYFCTYRKIQLPHRLQKRKWQIIVHINTGGWQNWSHTSLDQVVFVMNYAEQFKFSPVWRIPFWRITVCNYHDY